MNSAWHFQMVSKDREEEKSGDIKSANGKSKLLGNV